MDEMKKKNIKDYTAWDLNPSCFKPKTKRHLSKKFRRSARRRLDRELKGQLE